jgi:hypothetical protein
MSADRSKFIGSRFKHTVDEKSESRGDTIFLVGSARDNVEPERGVNCLEMVGLWRGLFAGITRYLPKIVLISYPKPECQECKKPRITGAFIGRSERI